MRGVLAASCCCPPSSDAELSYIVYWARVVSDDSGPLRQGSAWLSKGMLEFGGSLACLTGGSQAPVDQLRDLVQRARVLMREEDSKRQSVSLQRQRLSMRQ